MIRWLKRVFICSWRGHKVVRSAFAWEQKRVSSIPHCPRCKRWFTDEELDKMGLV